MDILTIAGILLAVGAILGGQVLEGGHIGSIMQFTAAIIVIGGTFGAMFIQSPMSVFKKGLQMLSVAFLDPKHDMKGDIKQIINLANLSRKQGLLALEGSLKQIRDPFFRKGVQLIVDGTDAKMIHNILEVEMEHEEEEGINGAKVWEAAGGYAPTIGIIGAVLGLIHVMENLSDPSKLGAGIAVAFVATVYGVGSANLFFLPVANKIKLKVKHASYGKAMIIAGLVGLAQGENPRLLQEKLEGYLPKDDKAKAGAKGKK